MSRKPPKIIGNSASLRAALASAKKVARSDLSVLITGESGTGKELFARLIHDESPRARKSFVAVNCAAIPAELMEAELFGHEKGAFTGAGAKKTGLFMEANGGTLFLDEIGDMPLILQAKILRVLQEGEFRPIGARAVQKVDVRIVAATHRDLAKMAVDGKFREDLIFRLEGYALRLPALRERGHDIVTLAQAFLKSRKEFSGKSLGRDAHALLMAYSWPGNVRELQNVILAAAVESPMTVRSQHVRPHLKGEVIMPEDSEASVPSRVVAALEQAGQKMTLAQLHADLQVPKPTLHRFLVLLVAEGRIDRVGSGRTVGFILRGEIVDQPESPLSDRQSQAVALVEKEGHLTRQQYANVFGVSIRTASRDLADMVRRGVLETDGQPGRFAGYAIPA